MIPAQFDYERPERLEDVLRLLGDESVDSVLLSGGHSLVPLLKLRMATPDRVIDLGGVPGLDSIDADDGGLRIGARATHATIAGHAIVGEGWPMLAEAASRIGDTQVRDWGTIGGACAHAHPSADWPAALIAARAVIVCVGLDGEREIPARDFFLGVFTTALDPGEVITEVRLPANPAGSGGAYLKLVRPSGDFAVAGAAVQLALHEDGSIAQAGIGLTGVSDVAFAATAAEKVLVEEQPSSGLAERAGELASEASEPIDDIHGSETYKRAMAAEMTRRAVELAVARAVAS